MLSPERSDRDNVSSNISSFKLNKRMTQLEEEQDDDDVFLSKEDNEVD